MTALEIEVGFQLAISKATEPFIGERSTPEVVKKLQHAVTEAAYDHYMDLSEEDIQKYEIRVPSPKVIVEGSQVWINNQRYL